ncbi:class I SAM-dependent methyltransferase [Paenibacillus caseinilyticus]|uniref:Methyltransferase n=1 Tax=Paenibacillus mucilaginosus K02 TaxID=997761 RepID=I0BIM9_9BACL|nr:class I SAM-dependent methyltransferase [Paenibacillus mucilaginosus]AFH62226.1 methyltransferase [Paenibacillus mucilaginosus K02]
MPGRERYWDRIYEALRPEDVRYDLWLETFRLQLELSRDTPVIDLGCGAGNDTLYLSERGYRVVACDASAEALRRVKELVPEADVRQMDLTEPLPFADGAAQVVIADLSLHYFPWDVTVSIVREIGRVLRPGGTLLCRVNSVRDTAFGAGQGVRLEPDYYEWEGQRKRFFDRKQLEELLREWELPELTESTMNRYGKPKVVWTAAAGKRG